MPDSVLANHLFGSEYGISAPLATLSRCSAGSAVGAGIVDDRSNSVSRYKGGAVTETESLGAKKFGVAGAAMHFPIRAIAGEG